MRRNIHNVMSDAFQFIGVFDNDVSIEFEIRGQVGYLSIYNRPNNRWQSANQRMSLTISYEDGQADPTLFVEFNDLFRRSVAEELMDYLANHPIDIGD